MNTSKKPKARVLTTFTALIAVMLISGLASTLCAADLKSDAPAPKTDYAPASTNSVTSNAMGSEVFKLRFGGWRQALARADLPTNSRSGPQASYRYEDVVVAVAAAWRELGRYPSVTRYDAWRAGRAQLPVAATARRFARSWDDLLVAAYPLVYPSVDSRAAGPRALDGALPDQHPARRSNLVAGSLVASAGAS